VGENQRNTLRDKTWFLTLTPVEKWLQSASWKALNYCSFRLTLQGAKKSIPLLSFAVFSAIVWNLKAKIAYSRSHPIYVHMISCQHYCYLLTQVLYQSWRYSLDTWSSRWWLNSRRSSSNRRQMAHVALWQLRVVCVTRTSRRCVKTFFASWCVTVIDKRRRRRLRRRRSLPTVAASRRQCANHPTSNNRPPVLTTNMRQNVINFSLRESYAIFCVLLTQIEW